jgi:alpha-beta hydrolase superfamily lysophospholipase
VILTFVNIALTASAVSLGFLYWYQERLVYFPSRVVEADPGVYGMAFESLSLTTDDGLEIQGWWVPAETPRATVLLLHGNAGNISHRLRTVAELNQLELSVLLIDYRGYGNSGGSPSERGTYLDALAAWRHLTETRGIAASEIIVLGRSLGGGVAT